MIAGTRAACALRARSWRRMLPSRVCFVAPNAYGRVSGRTDLRHIGGAEAQLALIGCGLVERGFAVSFVVWDHGQPDGIEHRGIRVFKTCAPSAGIGVLRFLHPRATSLWRALDYADADVYVQRTADDLTGLVAAWCRNRKRCFVYSVASDSDCDPRLPRLRTCRERVLYRYGLRRAARVVVQTLWQQRLLWDGFQIKGRMIRPCAADPPSNELKSIRTERPHVLWMGRFAPVKRLELLLDLAAACPEVDIDVVGAANRPSVYAERFCTRAKLQPNVALHGALPHNELERFYGRSLAVICTSTCEGFPNTFLEAWSRGVPVVSTFDPDGVVRRKRLGLIAEDVAGLAAAIRQLASDRDRYEVLSERVQRHFREYHRVAGAVNGYAGLIEELTCPSACDIASYS